MGGRKRSGCRIPRLLERLCPPTTNETRSSRTRNRRRKRLGTRQYVCDTTEMGFPILMNCFLVIPDYAKMRWYIRAPTGAQLKVWRDRVVKCFEFVPSNSSLPFSHSWTGNSHRAAAHATGCKHTITFGPLMYDLLQNPVLCEFW